MRLGLLSIFCLLALSFACDRSPQPPSAPAPKLDATADKQPVAHTGEDGHDHEDDHGDTGKGGEHAEHGVEIIELGTTTIGDLTVRATRDKGELKPGGDAPIDVWVLTSDGKPATVSAVRFWIGTEDTKGSIKAKADIEIPAEPNHWHTHVEAPDPMPEDSKLWVEIETGNNGKLVCSFGLKT